LALGLFEFQFQSFKLLLQFARLVDLCFLALPAGLQAGRFFLHPGQFLLDFRQALLAGGILLLFQGLPLHLVLHHRPLDLVDLSRHRI